MLFKPGTPLYKYLIEREQDSQVMYINYLGAQSVPNLAGDPDTMGRTIDFLIEYPNVSRIVFFQQRNYSYGFKETLMLQEISNIYSHLINQEKIVSPSKLSVFNSNYLPQRIKDISYLLSLLKRDPVACFIELNRLIEAEKMNLLDIPESLKLDMLGYLRILEKFLLLLKNTGLIKEAQKYFSNYSFGKRDIYYNLFRPDIIPNFTFTRLMATLPEKAEILSQYTIGSGYDQSTVVILKRKEDTKHIYHLMAPEYSLDDQKQEIVNAARSVLIGKDFYKSDNYVKGESDSREIRRTLFNIAKGLIGELSQQKDLKLDYSELNKLANILVRNTSGFGVIEILLQDKNIQDIVLNAPISANNIFLRHADFDECITNLIPSKDDADSWATKFRLLSGRPLDEANPILDTDLVLGNIRARVAVIQEPLSPDGLSYALRRHREEPWTLPLFIKNKMINSLTAGLFSFLIDGSRTLLIAGTRSSGKTSLLGSLMLEIMPRYRIIVIEDTLELPVDSLRKLSYDIIRMKVRGSLLEKSNEVGADEGIRTSLRLGDSSLIVGEVRSLEAKALYEAMRVGALANVVAGTIHGASPYGVFDRVVNDLEVPPTSFKATDCIIIANPVKAAGGLKSSKRVLQLTEIRKHWIKDPEEEGGFVDLLKYNVEKDELEPTDELINGDSEIIKDIAASVKGWAGDWDAVYDNIMLRAKIKQEMVNTSIKLNNPDLIEAKFNSLSNNMFQQFSREVYNEIGLPTSERVFPMWQEWLKEQISGKKI